MTSEPQRLRLVDTEPRVVRTAAPDIEPREPDGEASRALEHVVSRFDAFIRRSARRHGLRGDEIDEVVQEIRVRMWKSLGTAELIRRAKASYIYRAAISASIDLIRRRRARRYDARSLDDDTSDDAPAPAPESRLRADAALDEEEVASTVHRALALLAEHRRAVVRMHLAGYDRFEIAELLGWSEPKTRNLLYRGLTDLRQILQSWGIGPVASQASGGSDDE
jgi:RNA polymerase sigma-70 factor (ECF subfamily)